MTRSTFVGGIHPYEGKELSKDKPIQDILPKNDLVYPLSQHIGAPAVPLVKPGDKVLVGQKIAEAGGFVSACICSAVSGTVKAIEQRRVVTGDMVSSIVIENDHQYEEKEIEKPRPLEDLSREEIITYIKEAGIVGMGGAGFPTHVKLSVKEPEKIEYVIVNCAECEPYLTSDYRRMVEEPDKIIQGLQVVLSLFPNAKGILAIEDNKQDCIELFKEKTVDEPRILVKKLKTKYPQGAERSLIYAVTKRKLDSTRLPADVGCVVNNADTIVAVCQAVIHGRPLMERIVTITGDAIKEPGNFRVKIGTNYSELIEAAGGFKSEPEKIISGGPMMGFGIFETDLPTTKTASALVCLTRDEVSLLEPTACINCGRCLEVCPARLMPNKLSDFSAKHKEEEFLNYYGMECVECGCCSYVCPAKRYLAQNIKSMRKLMLGKKKK
ncbi:MAG: electron transport complex subunit RsxC [Lachnospiraceae bacterium]|nr:electron transport complex subunit RsxC [Lachnospiraceae bacterium]